MNGNDDNLALRKELLIARSSLCRLKIRHEVQCLRNSLTWREAGAAAAQSPAARDALFLLAAEGIGRERTARWLAVAGQVLAIAKLVSLVVQMRRTPPAGPAEPAQP